MRSLCHRRPDDPADEHGVVARLYRLLNFTLANGDRAGEYRAPGLARVPDQSIELSVSSLREALGVRLVPGTEHVYRIFAG